MEVIAIQKEKAEALPGADAVFTWQDVPLRPYTTATHEDRILAQLDGKQ
jgi:hypothetical protein